MVEKLYEVKILPTTESDHVAEKNAHVVEHISKDRGAIENSRNEFLLFVSELPLASWYCPTSATRHSAARSVTVVSNVSQSNDDLITRTKRASRNSSHSKSIGCRVGVGPRSSLWSVLLVSVLIQSSSSACLGLQFPSLFDNRSSARQHATAQTKHRSLFGGPLPPPPTSQCATTFPTEVQTESSKVTALSEATETVDIQYDHHHITTENNEGELVGLESSHLSQVPPITSEDAALSDSWWEDDEDEAEKATLFAEDKRNRMIAARREILFDRTNHPPQHRPPTSSPHRRRQQESPNHVATAATRRASPKGAASQILMGAIRKAAVASAASTTSTEAKDAEAAKQRARSSRSIIESTISDLLDQQMERQGRDLRNELHDSLHGPLRPDGWPVGILGDTSDNHVHYPMPGTILIHPTPPQSHTSNNNKNKKGAYQDYSNSITVRVATPLDDVDIALLRLSVFSDFSEEVRQQFCSRSCDALANRRLRGATCLVATTTTPSLSSSSHLPTTCSDKDVAPAAASFRGSRPEIVLGSVECSFHEFKNTALGRRRPERSILYITEFAVSPTVRRRGIGARLLQAVDELANLRQVESLYLHVDVTNHAALALYNRAGYKRVTSKEFMFDEFTTSLNLHDGATKGRKHFLLCKHLCDNPTWLPSQDGGAESIVSARSLVFGFEIPG